jgi:hypothetical protein
MKLVSQIFLIIAFIAISSCKKVINVDLNNAAPQIVIEGIVTNSSAAQVTISKSVKFSENNSFPAVTGAIVTIADNLNHSYILSETQPGVYTNSILTGVSGLTYQLTVNTGGITYTATSVMPIQVPLDTLLTDQIAFGNKTIKIVEPQYSDPAAFANYYWFVETIKQTVNKKIFVWDDNLTNGGISNRPLIENDSTINSGDTIQVEMRCIDKNIYRYLRGLEDLQNNASTPANPDTNISGGALGYFSAHTRQVKKVKMP